MLEIKESMTKSDFDKMVKLEDLEYFTSLQLKNFVKESSDQIIKSEGSQEEMYHELAVEIRSFKPVIVWDDKLEKSIYHVRKRQVEWDKPEGDDISKARGGIYLNTPENQKLGRVGQKYGGKKAEVEGKKEDTKSESEGKEEEEGRSDYSKLDSEGKLKYHTEQHERFKNAEERGDGELSNYYKKLADYHKKEAEKYKGEEKNKDEGKVMNEKINTEKELKVFVDKHRANIIEINGVKFGKLYPMLEVTNKHAQYYDTDSQGYKSLSAPFTVILK